MEDLEDEGGGGDRGSAFPEATVILDLRECAASAEDMASDIQTPKKKGLVQKIGGGRPLLVAVVQIGD